LILGNHDKNISQHPTNFIGNQFFESVQHYKEINRYSQKVCLFHFSLRTWNKQRYGSWHLWGHSHGNLPPLGLSVDVGVDCKEITPEYRPIEWEEIKLFMDKQQAHTPDHHKLKEAM
jgi:calcineurin-like phosphoesterase family protein